MSEELHDPWLDKFLSVRIKYKFTCPKCGEDRYIASFPKPYRRDKHGNALCLVCGKPGELSLHGEVK